MNPETTMSEKVSKWLDMVYKVAVLIGSMALVYAHATFASKEDIAKVSHSINDIEKQLVRIDAAIAAQTTAKSYLSDELRVVKESQKEMDARIRNLERK